MKLNYVRRFSAYVSTFYHSEYITISSLAFLLALFSDVNNGNSILGLLLRLPSIQRGYQQPNSTEGSHGGYKKW